MSLVHIRRSKPGTPDDVYCGHPAPESWNYGEEEASCADCIRGYLQETVDEYREALLAFVMHRNPVPGVPALWVVSDSAMTRAEVLLGMLEKKS